MCIKSCHGVVLDGQFVDSFLLLIGVRREESIHERDTCRKF